MRPLLLLAAAIALPAADGPQPPRPTDVPRYDGPKFETTRLADGVYAFVFDNPLGPAVDGTAVAIINDDDVVVVDTQNTPWASRAVLAEIRKLTTKPVRYVINTHWHGDHWQGNEVYRDAFPGVEFVAHPNTLADIRTQAMPQFDSTRLVVIPQMLRDFEGRYAAGRRRDGTNYNAADSAYARELISLLRWLAPAVRDIRDVPPTLTVADSLVLHRGRRTIAIRYLGRGNTRGDLTVWLPEERVLVTGDLLVNPVPYGIGSYLGDWVRTLGALRALPARVIVPGHGAIQRDHAYLELVVALLESTLAQARAAVARGADLEATRRLVNLDSLRQRFTGGDAARARAFDAYFVQPAVERAWREARGELPPGD
jgi:glyoxylase-like metal-dependent hydrolase (beta-lactamase superfamily II)